MKKVVILFLIAFVSQSSFAFKYPQTEQSLSLDMDSRKSDCQESFDEHKIVTAEFGYAAGNFDNIKASGFYGVTFTIMPWKIASKLYIGAQLSPFNLNVGLVETDYRSNLLSFGPALGYYFSPYLYMIVPLNIKCNIYFNKEAVPEACVWGMSLAPTLYIGKKMGAYFGPEYTMNFKTFGNNHTIYKGFRIGMFF